MSDKIEARINSRDSLTDFCQSLVDFWLEHKWITIVAYSKRSKDQNSCIRECYKQIRVNNPGWTAKYVERLCKLQHGVPILSQSDSMDAEVFNIVLGKENITFDQQLKFMDCFSVTSKMTPSQASMMIHQLIDDYPFIHLEKKKNGKYF